MSNQPPKDFLALSHGHEWVNFYESFDKLVQDHLSASSELLRKAMALPEVADREVAEVRDVLEKQLEAEREHNKAALHTLKAEVSAHQEQVASLVLLANALAEHVSKLSRNLESAIQTAAEHEARTEAAAAAVDSVTNERGETSSGMTGTLVSPEESSEEWSNLVSAAEGESDEEIDLTALAAMEEESVPEEEPTAATNGSERVRPHWLSMARTGSGS
jgi:chromosome segregation ATPase